jgi:hypothetical protein
MVAMLQGTAGNRAVAALLAARSPTSAAATAATPRTPALQGKLWPYKGADNKALKTIGEKVSGDP